MDLSDIQNALRPWREKHRKAAWRPRIAANKSTGATSWFGGTPEFASVEGWPSCVQCEQPMQFLLQLHSKDLPASYVDVASPEIIQLFFCSTDDGQCETWEPFSGCHAVRRITDYAEPVKRPASVAELTSAPIIGWDELEDWPHGEEEARIGVVSQYDFASNSQTLTCSELNLELTGIRRDLDVEVLIGQPTEGDKLGGWPAWVQGPEYPDCPRCLGPMRPLFQLDSNNNLDITFGDLGRGHITRCLEHPDVLAFGWACY